MNSSSAPVFQKQIPDRHRAALHTASGIGNTNPIEYLIQDNTINVP